MSQKYNISSIINDKLKENEDDENETIDNDNNTTQKPKTAISTNAENETSLKDKSLDEVINDLNNIASEYSSKDYIDAPEELELSTIEVPTKSDEELLEIAKSSLENKYNTSKTNTNDSFEKQINNLINKQEEYKNTSQEKTNSINEYYNSATKETEDQALKRGLARSSIVIEQLAGLNQNKASELVNVMNELQTNLETNANNISELEKERDLALNNLDIEYAIELNDKLNKVKSDYEKSVQDAIEFNNNVEKLKAEYKLDLDKQKLDKQTTITEMEKEYKVDYISQQIKDAQYNYLKNYFDSLDKDYAISLFLTNKDLKTILGDNYSKMYKYLTNK